MGSNVAVDDIASTYIAYNWNNSFFNDYPLYPFVSKVEQIGSLRILPPSNWNASITKITTINQANSYIEKNYQYHLDRTYAKMLVHSQSDKCKRQCKNCTTCDNYTQSFIDNMNNPSVNGNINDYMDTILRWLLYINYRIEDVTEVFHTVDQTYFNQAPYVIVNSIGHEIDGEPNIINLCTPIKLRYLRDEPNRESFTSIVKNKFFLMPDKIKEDEIKRYSRAFYKHLPTEYEMGVIL